MNRAAVLPVQGISRFFRALGDETRVRIVALLSHGELCVCHLQAALRLSQPNVSRHLGVLRNAGVVKARREGSWMHYALREPPDPDCRPHMRAFVRTFSKRAALRREAAASARGCGPSACK